MYNRLANCRSSILKYMFAVTKTIGNDAQSTVVYRTIFLMCNKTQSFTFLQNLKMDN